MGGPLIQYDWCPYKKGKFERGIWGECYMKMKAEIRVMFLQAKEQQRLSGDHLKLSKRHGTDSLSQPQKIATC